MKTTLTLVFLALATTLSAQLLRVTVRSDNGQPVPYTYVFANGAGVGVTDSLGVARVEMQQLHLGDTLSSLCIGTTRGWVLYDLELKERGTCEIVVHELSYSIDAVVVTPDDMEPFFAKHAKDIFPPRCNGLLSARFEVTVTLPGEAPRHLSGSLQVENEIVGRNLERPYQYSYFHHPVSLLTSDDTTHLSALVDEHTRNALRGGIYRTAAFLMSRWSRNQARKEHGMRFQYLGSTEGVMRFRVMYVPFEERGYSAQTLLYLDEGTKSLVRSEFVSMEARGTERKNWRIDTDHVNQQYRRGPAVLLPRNIHYQYDDQTGCSVDLTITDARYEPK